MAHPFPGMWLKSPAINAHSHPRGARAAATTHEKKADFPPVLFSNHFFSFSAKDLDDALHVTRLPDGRIQLGVHIADVSYYVRPGNPLDEEASIRATTV
mgnify:CR=1 FL=1